MIAVILVGGEGTRLRPLTLDRPKAMLPIGGRPFLAHMLERLAAAGVTRVDLLCGYLPDPIVAGFGDQYDGMALEYAVEPEPMDTAGAIRFAIEGRLDGDAVLRAQRRRADGGAARRADGVPPRPRRARHRDADRGAPTRAATASC